jgi:hypothetical protein
MRFIFIQKIMSADLEQEEKQLKQELNVIFHRPILDPRHLKIAIIFNEYFFVYCNCFRNFRKQEEHEGPIIVWRIKAPTLVLLSKK